MDIEVEKKTHSECLCKLLVNFVLNTINVFFFCRYLMILVNSALVLLFFFSYVDK